MHMTEAIERLFENIFKTRLQEETLREERGVSTVEFKFPDNLKAASDIHAQSQISGVLNVFGRGVFNDNEVRIGPVGSSHSQLSQGMQDSRRFYFGYRANGNSGTVYIVAKNGMDEDAIQKPAVLQQILSQVFDKYRLGVNGRLRLVA